MLFDWLLAVACVFAGAFLTFLFHMAFCRAVDEDVFRQALERIREKEGRVCAEYDTCAHRGCHSSYNAWAIADAALTGTEVGTAKTSGWWGCHKAASMRRDVAGITNKVLEAGRRAVAGEITSEQLHEQINAARAALGIGPLPSVAEQEYYGGLPKIGPIYGELARPEND